MGGQAVLAVVLLGGLAAVGSASPAAALESPPTFVSEWGSLGGVPGAPVGVAVDPTTGDFYVTDSIFGNRVMKFDSTGAFLSQWGAFGTGDGEFDVPLGVAVDATTGDVYVADVFNDRGQRVDSAGA